LPPSPPLRTGRVSFLTSGSSLSLRPCHRTRFPTEMGHLRDTNLEPTRPVVDHKRRATAPTEGSETEVSVVSGVICLLTCVGSSNLLARKDQREVCPLTRGMMFSCESIPLSPITGQHSLFPSSFTNHTVSAPYGVPSCKQEQRLAYHVPYVYHAYRESLRLHMRLRVAPHSSNPTTRTFPTGGVGTTCRERSKVVAEIGIPNRQARRAPPSPLRANPIVCKAQRIRLVKREA
jgi:hypothetical protein